VTLAFAGTIDRSAVPHATDLVVALISRPEVAAAWDQESSCAGMTVGGLTHHLVSQPVNVVKLVGADPTVGAEAQTISVLEHYARAAWLREDLDGDTNRSIRESSDQQASDGIDVAIGLVTDARSVMDEALADMFASTYIPWQGWRLATDDFLVTRLMEMVVHADDLAASVAVASPDFGFEVLDPVFRLLTALATRKHGQDALVRTLTRPQRAPGSVSAF